MDPRRAGGNNWIIDNAFLEIHITNNCGGSESACVITMLTV